MSPERERVKMREPHIVKDSGVKRFASVRYAGVLADGERASASRILASVGATATSWNAAAGRTYAFVRFADDTEAAAVAAASGAEVREPSLVVLRIRPRASERLGALAEALGGPGGLAGVVLAAREPHALVIELDAARTPLGLLVATVDAELARASGRTLEPLLPLADDALAAFAAHVLGEPDLDASRLIETHLEPLLQGNVA
jgi:hypothetical protein